MSLDIDAPGYKFGSKFVKWVDSGWGFRVHCFLTFTRAHTMSLAHWLLPPNSQNRWRRDSFQVQLNNSPLTFQGPWPKVFNFQVLWRKVKLGRLPCTFLCRQDDCLSINSLNRVSGQWNDTFRCEIFSRFFGFRTWFPLKNSFAAALSGVELSPWGDSIRNSDGKQPSEKRIKKSLYQLIN